MQKISLFILLAPLLYFINSFNSIGQPSSPEIFLVPVTSSPSPLLRLQFAYENDSVQIYGTNMAALPLALKKSKFVNPKARLNFDHTTRSAEASMERNYALQRDTSLGFRTKLTGQSYYNVLKASFLSGKGSSPIFINQNIKLGGFPALPTWPQNFSASVSGAGVYTVNYLPAATLDELPVLDQDDCNNATESFYKLRAAQGYGMDKIIYKPYNARRRETAKKTFDIFFESNSTQPKVNEIKAVVDYLEQNRFEILHAAMEGGSSVEGDETRNKKLQRDRARVISAALARYNKSSIKKDTILLSDNWPKFREQIKASAFSWLDTLPNEKILEKINGDDKLRKSIEPILKTQRKASLNLTMAKVLTADDQFVTLKRSLNGWLKSQSTLKQPSKETEQQIMGAIAYLFEQHMNDELSNEEVDSLLEGDFLEQKYLYLGLHIMKQFTDGKFGKEDKESWKQTWTSFELHTWFKRAQSSLITLTYNASRLDLPRYTKMQIDFQSFAFRLVNLGVMAAEDLCHPPYPTEPEYSSFILNNSAFQYEYLKLKGTECDCMVSRKQLTGLDWMNSLKTDSASQISSFEIDSAFISLSSDLVRTGFTKRSNTKPKYDSKLKGDYYELIKQSFLKGGKAPGSLDAYSLYHFIELNVLNWKPAENFYFDRDVRLEEIDRLVATLKKGSSICGPIVNKLYLDYHIKALRYLEQSFEPGSTKHKEIADGSLKFISEYYKSRIPKMQENVVLPIAYFLNQFNWFPGASEGARFGFDLLSAIARKRKLSDAEMKLWANYLKIYDPELKNPLPASATKEIVLATMRQLY